MKTLTQKIEGDKVIWMVVLILSLISILAVYSSVSALAYSGGTTSFKYLFKHGVMLAMGFGVMYVLHRIHFKYFSKLSSLLIWAAGIMLVLTMLFGAEINDARRWIKIPLIGLTFQTSDFAKVVLVIYVARMLNQNRTILHDFKNGVRPILIPIVVICGLILPSDFSTAALLALVCFFVMFLGGVPVRHLLKVAGIGVVGLLLIYALGKVAPDILPRFETWAQRIENFGDSDSEGNFQVQVAQLAIHDGGIFGQGLGSGDSRNYMPQSYSDMIYAFIIQEYGSLIGGVGLILLYLIFFYRSVQIALKCPKHIGSMMALGLGLMIFLQALVNMAVSVSLFPTTGQPLPLICLGGTSTLITCTAIGIILSVSRSVFNPESFGSMSENRASADSGNEIRNSETEYEVA